MFKLAHLSDPHLGPLAGFSLHQLIGKRATGYVNWRRKRRHAHDMDILARIVADIPIETPRAARSEAALADLRQSLKSLLLEDFS